MIANKAAPACGGNVMCYWVLTMSKKEYTLIGMPIICGLIFVAVVFLNHALFKAGYISARAAIGHEMLFVIPGLIANIVQLPYAIYSLFKLRWQKIILCVLSTSVFWGGLTFGISKGAAIMYAT